MVTEPLDLDAVAGAATDGGAGTGDGSAGTGDGDGSRAPPETDLGHVHLEVTDLDAAETFYVDGLGFDLQATYPGACFVGAGGYHHHVGANTWEGRTAPAPESGPGLAWFEVVLPAEGDLEALRSRLDEHEVTVDGTDDGFAAEDPDGIRIRFRTAR
jgi:catechol 2,3-dioxygenase